MSTTLSRLTFLSASHLGAVLKESSLFNERNVMRRSESGQAILLVVVACGIFLIGAVGLAIDGAQIYAHREMAQAAADAAAQAGIFSIFAGTGTAAYAGH